jgi:hypothetical protein
MRAAVRKLRVEDVAKLQALVVENFDAIEPGLTVLDARLLLGHATIDVIGVDAVGALVLGAVGFSANEEMLLKAVEAYSWCLEYPEALVRLYPSCQVSEDRPPRLLFVVERMPDAFHRKIKQLGFPEVDCVEFRHLEFDGVPAVYFESLLRMRRTVVPANSRLADPESTASPVTAPSGAGENVITMNGSATRATGAKLQKILTQASPEAAAPRASERVTPSRESAPVVSMVSRQATAPAPRVDRPRPAEPVALRQPEPLVAEPVLETMVELDADPIVASLTEAIPELEPAPALPELPEVPVRPATLDVVPAMAVPSMTVPSMAPAHVVTATSAAPIVAERVSFKELSTEWLGEAREPVVAATTPSVIEPPVVETAPEPVAAPVELVLESSVTLEAPQPMLASPALEEIVALAAEPAPAEAPAPRMEPTAMPALTLESATPAAPAPAVEELAKPAAPPLPQGFEGLKFPNDGVLTRQWMEFLSQMSASK